MKLGQWIGLLGLLVALYVLWAIRDLLLLLFGAVVLANSLNMMARRLQRSGLPRSSSVFVAIACLIAFIVGFFWLVVPSFATQFRELAVLVPLGLERFNSWFGSLDQTLPPSLRAFLPDIDSLNQQLQPYAQRALSGSLALFSSSLGNAINILLIFVLALMMLINPLAYRRGFIRLFPSFYRRRVDGILLECETALGRWVIGALISMVVIAALSFTGLSIIGVKAALANAVLAGLLNFIPNIGPTISVIPPMAIALLDAPQKSLLVLALYIGIQQVESNLLTPYVMSQQVALLPAVTLLAQVFFATLFGFWGLLLALPLTVVGQIWLRRVLLEDVMDRWGEPEEPIDVAIVEAAGTYAPTVVTETVLQSDEPTDSRSTQPPNQPMGSDHEE